MINIKKFFFNLIEFCAIVCLLAKSLASVMLLLLTFLTNSLYSAFLTTSVFNTLLSVLKSMTAISNF